MSIIYILKKFSGLKFLSLRECDSITNIVLTLIGKNCPNLTFISIYDYKSVNFNNIKAIVNLSTGCSKLYLYQLTPCIGSSNSLTNKGLSLIINNCTNITDLCLDGNDKLTNESLIDRTENSET
jgi:hypothetical protein